MASETDYVNALRAEASARGDEFQTVRGGIRIHVRYYPGSSSHLVLNTPYVGRAVEGAAPIVAIRPLEIQLRAENEHDRRAKAKGIAIEAQTGDAEFDRAVFVDSPTEHDVVAQVLGSPALRQAVRELLEVGITPVTLDEDGRIEILVRDFSRLRRDPAWLLETLATIAREVPEVRASGAKRKPDPWPAVLVLLGVLGLIGMVLTPLAVFTVLPDRCYVSDGEGSSLSCVDPACCQPLTLGGGAGALLGVLLAFSLFRAIRGTSSAHRIRLGAALAAFVVCVEAGLLFAHLAGAVLLP